MCCVVAKSCPTLQPHGRSLPGSSVHGILQARILEWVAIPFSRASSWPMDWTQVSCITGRFFTIWATKGAPYMCVCVYIHTHTHTYTYLYMCTYTCISTCILYFRNHEFILSSTEFNPSSFWHCSLTSFHICMSFLPTCKLWPLTIQHIYIFVQSIMHSIFSVLFHSSLFKSWMN